MYYFERGDDDYSFKDDKTFEQKLEKYKHTMEFIRTIIGFIVLGIQIIILYNLLN